MHKKIHQIEEPRQALVVGFFGPIGVSAVFYLYISREFLRGINQDGVVRDDAEHLSEIMLVVIWFLAICSIVSDTRVSFLLRGTDAPQVLHGINTPLGKLGFTFQGLSRPRFQLNASLVDRRTSLHRSVKTPCRVPQLWPVTSVAIEQKPRVAVHLYPVRSTFFNRVSALYLCKDIGRVSYRRCRVSKGSCGSA
jgi:hypothetical protein